MKKLILAQVLTTNGTAECSGLYDENGDPVTVEIEKDDSGVSLTIWQNSYESLYLITIYEPKRPLNIK